MILLFMNQIIQLLQNFNLVAAQAMIIKLQIKKNIKISNLKSIIIVIKLIMKNISKKIISNNNNNIIKIINQ